MAGDEKGQGLVEWGSDEKGQGLVEWGAVADVAPLVYLVDCVCQTKRLQLVVRLGILDQIG